MYEVSSAVLAKYTRIVRGLFNSLRTGFDPEGVYSIVCGYFWAFGKFKQRFPSAFSQISSLIGQQMSQEFSAVNWEVESHLHAGTWPTASGWKCSQVPRQEVRLERIS